MVKSPYAFAIVTNTDFNKFSDECNNYFAQGYEVVNFSTTGLPGNIAYSVMFIKK